MSTSAKRINTVGVALCAAVALTAGCASTKQAGLIYSSAISMGVGMDAKPGDAAAPLSISIGFKALDVAYVPVAVMETNGAGKETADRIWASHSQQSGQAEKCRAALREMSASKSATTSASSGGTPSATATDLPAACDAKTDAMSVYGQFNSDAAAKGKEQSAGLLVGKVFATGVAAQNVSAAALATAYAGCATAVKASGIPAAELSDETKRVCTSTHHR